MTNETINFKVARDFGETFNVSVKFLRENFKSYFLCILLLAGPFVLLNSFAAAYYQSIVITKTSLVRAGRLYGMNLYNWQYFLSIFTQFVSLLSIMCTNYAFMVVYSEKGSGNFAVKDVAKKLNENAVKILIGFFVFFILIMIFGVAITVVVGLMGEASAILGVLLVLLLLVGLLLLGPNLLWQLSVSFLVIIAENEIAFNGFGRARKVMKNNYWWTWLIIVCSSFMIFIIALLFALPASIFSLFKIYSHSTEIQETSLIFMLTFVICTFLSSITYSILYLICGFHFFSLAEKRDGKGLMERINEIGKPQQSN